MDLQTIAISIYCYGYLTIEERVYNYYNYQLSHRNIYKLYLNIYRKIITTIKYNKVSKTIIPTL